MLEPRLRKMDPISLYGHCGRSRDRAFALREPKGREGITYLQQALPFMLMVPGCCWTLEMAGATTRNWRGDPLDYNFWVASIIMLDQCPHWQNICRCALAFPNTEINLEGMAPHIPFADLALLPPHYLDLS